MEYSSSTGGDAERLPLGTGRVPLSFRGDKRSSSSVSSATPDPMVSGDELPAVALWFLSAIRASFNGERCESCKISSVRCSCDRVRLSLIMVSVIGPSLTALTVVPSAQTSFVVNPGRYR